MSENTSHKWCHSSRDLFWCRIEFTTSWTDFLIRLLIRSYQALSMAMVTLLKMALITDWTIYFFRKTNLYLFPNFGQQSLISDLMKWAARTGKFFLATKSPLLANLLAIPTWRVLLPSALLAVSFILCAYSSLTSDLVENSQVSH